MAVVSMLSPGILSPCDAVSRARLLVPDAAKMGASLGCSEEFAGGAGVSTSSEVSSAMSDVISASPLLLSLCHGIRWCPYPPKQVIEQVQENLQRSGNLICVSVFKQYQHCLC